MTETGWVIERGDSEPSAPLYWAGHYEWERDHLKAVRFSRKEDAERVAERERTLDDGGPEYARVCEHSWG